MKKTLALIFLFLTLFQLHATSSALTVDPCDPPSILTSPSDVAGCMGSNASFSVSAGGTSLTYQWQEQVSSSFHDIQDGSVYTNTQTSTLNINVQAGMAGTNYRCVVSGSCGSPVISGSATLMPGMVPAIYTHPDNTSGCMGGNASFTVSAGATNISYQWQENTGSGFVNINEGSVYHNVQTSTFNIIGIPAGLGGTSYRCVISGSCTPSVNSNSASLHVYSRPAIDAGDDQLVCPGESVTLSGSGGVSYTWDNGVSDGVSFVPSVSTLTYTVTGTDANDCVNTDEVTVTINTCTGVSKGTDSDSDLILYPNPANDIIHVNYSGSEFPEKIIVFNMQGEEVITVAQMRQIPVDQLSSGLYTLEVIFKEKVLTRKFVIE